MSAAADARVQWLSAAPLWDGALDAGQAAAEMRRPAILRFASDSFMEELAALLEDEPRSLEAVVAEQPPGAGGLTLYLAVHGHFHLLAASLVCRLPGLPDRRVDAAADERAGFVLRRLGEQEGEMAWAPETPPRGPRSWRALPPGEAASLVGGEEVLPLFPVQLRLAGRRRRILAGLVPTYSGEVSAAGLPKIAGDETRYRLRCVYLRPRCGPLRPDLVSDPSTHFRIAAFDEEDAPHRPWVVE
jgi:hypothetical protein